MKICIVGNSQAAALKEAVPLAVKSMATYTSVSFDTYAIPGGRGPDLGVRNGRIYPMKNAKRLFTDIDGVAETGLDLAAYDAVLFSAVGLPAHRLQFDFHVLNKIAEADLVACTSALERQLVSSSVFSNAVDAEIKASEAVHSVLTVRELFKGPLFVQGWPLPSRELIDRNDTDLQILYGDNLWTFLSRYYRVQRKSIEMVCESVGATLLPLAIEGSLESGFTPTEFCSKESWHMNAAYGELVLKAVVERLAA